MKLPRDVVSTYLYVVSTMGMRGDSMIVGGGGLIGGLGSSLGGDNKSGESTTEEDRFLIPEEVATYHDLCSKPTESSISLRIKSLASKGDAVAAEELLEAFKVSFFYHVVQPLVCFMSHSRDAKLFSSHYFQ